MENKNSQPIQAPINSALSGSATPTPRFLSKKGAGIALGFIALSFLIAFIIGGFMLAKNDSSRDVACTLEAKICPDGSSVGRTGPKCEFSPCPTATPDPKENWEISESEMNASWNKVTNIKYNFSFEMPKEWDVKFYGDRINFYSPETTEILKYLPPEKGYGISITADPTTESEVTNKLLGVVTSSPGDDSPHLLHLKTFTLHGVKVIQSEANWEGYEITSNFIKNGFLFFVNFSSFTRSADGTPLKEQFPTYERALSTFKFTDSSLSCTPRPSCFDSTPRCLMPETSDMCPPSATPTKTKTTDKKIFCTQEAKQCPDGITYVVRTGPNCEFAKCPTQ